MVQSSTRLTNFELDIRQMSSVPEKTQEERLEYILRNFDLDQAQQEAFDKSIFAIRAGISLIQGPPGTGKARVALVIILALVVLNLRVLLAAGSNKAVDNLAAAVANAMSSHPKLARSCVSLVRFKTPSYQLSVLQKDIGPACEKGKE